jgi:tRNA(fMet)-specific endonuclease VapC
VAVTEILLDTNAYAAAIRGDAEARWIVQQAESIAINTIVLGELLAGFRLGKHEQENRDRLSQFLSVPRVKKLVLNETTAEHYASLKALLRTTGKPIPTNDLWIAATAFQYNLDLFSFDAHFQSIPNLKLITKLADFPPD